jgi:hypothetical protein
MADLEELRLSFLSTIKEFLNEESSLKTSTQNVAQNNVKMAEYIQNKTNQTDALYTFRQEQKRLSNFKVNEKILKQQKLHNKNFEINWNMNYCEYCKVDYWPFNCRVYTLPKAKCSYKTAKLNTKHKLFDYRPKYKSYRDKLIKNVLNRGIKLVYECKSCKKRNVIIDELKRKQMKPVSKLTKKLREKSLVNTKFLFNSKSAPNLQNNLTQNNYKKASLVISNNNAKKKFASLQMRLKLSETEEEKLKMQKEQSFGSLASFLQNL